MKSYELFFSKKNFENIQMERNGNKFIMRAAHPGEPLQVVGIKEMADMPDPALAGLFICSHDPDIKKLLFNAGSLLYNLIKCFLRLQILIEQQRIILAATNRVII